MLLNEMECRKEALPPVLVYSTKLQLIIHQSVNMYPNQEILPNADYFVIFVEIKAAKDMIRSVG